MESILKNCTLHQLDTIKEINAELDALDEKHNAMKEEWERITEEYRRVDGETTQRVLALNRKLVKIWNLNVGFGDVVECLTGDGTFSKCVVMGEAFIHHTTAFINVTMFTSSPTTAPVLTRVPIGSIRFL